MVRDGEAKDRKATLELMLRGVAALQAHDWDTLRGLCADDVAWHVPGRGPWAGTSKGIDAVMERWQRGAAIAAGQQAEILAVMASEDMGVAVQRPPVAVPSGDDPLTVLTLCTFRDRLIVHMRTYYSDQYAVDGFDSLITPPGERQ